MNPTDFYRAFEDRYRGSAELIASRLAVYLPFVRAVSRTMPDAMLTDVGCGRGEWLALLDAAQVPAQGVDLDDAMLQACRERGLNVERGDAIDYLKRLPDASQFAVTAFHFAEHIPFDSVHVLMREAMRALRSGGLLIIETPNPESLIVSTTDFRLDPSHDVPIPPKLLAFVAEFHGFEDVKVLRLHERQDLTPGKLSLWDVLTGTSPDYALVARKPGAALPQEAAEALVRDYGVTLQSLALEFDHTMRVTVADLGDRIAQTRDSAEAFADGVRQQLDGVQQQFDGVQQHFDDVQQRFQDELASVRNEQAAMRAQLAGLDNALRTMLQSRSWRITAPLRWAAEQARRIRQWLRGQDVTPSTIAAQAPSDAPTVELSERGRKVLREIDTGDARE